MDLIIRTLTPIFMVALAIQMLIEIMDPLLDKLFDGAGKDLKAKVLAMPASPDRDQLLSEVAAGKKRAKGFWLKTLSIAIGLALSMVLGLRVLGPLGLSAVPGWIDVFVTGLCISNGTEGLNSVLKFIGALKDSKTSSV